MQINNGTFLNGDCLELMKEIPDGSIDMILCDLPYGTTSSQWDSVIPFEPLWEQYLRVAKKNAAIVLTSAQPFTTDLINSQRKYFKYQWYWIKTNKSGFQNAKKQPLRCVEDVCVFYRELPTYNPQGVIYNPVTRKNSKSSGGTGVQGKSKGGALRTEGHEYIQEYSNYPSQILEFESATSTVHPTQKPVPLFEYLIKTYTNEGEIVLDNTAGSGTTALAAERSKRRWICIEQNEEYYEIATNRVKDRYETTDDDLFSWG